MSVIGTVKSGVFELPPDAQLEEGQRVEVLALSVSPEDAFVLRETVMAAPPVRDLPDDLAPNLDYYLHGHDHKQQPRRGRWIPAAKRTPELTEPQTEELDCISLVVMEDEDIRAALTGDRHFEQAGFTALLK